ncbi:hypothetical protein [Alienimonas californiensis]|uniref:Uncharacterized protein n=1 Tax=Alienimonas californiensis TaxID=2527989 RepID=A0A517PD96_9PLAN|nr:hypothetical protein [Alienimonas californiensis]QDT17350.1 hypothetical protein CA12_34710 [Alienimonas californiensis]
MTPLLLAALSLAPLADPAGAAGPEYLLRYKFEPETSLRHEIVTTVTIDSVSQGAPQLVQNAGKTVQRMDVLPLPADAAEGTAGVLRVHSEKVKLSAQFDAQPPTSYDSEKDEPVVGGYEQVDAVAKAPLGELTVSDLGQVTHAVSLLPGMENLAPEEAADVYKDLFPRLPEERVAVGQSWVQTLKVRVQEGKLAKPWTLRRRSTLTKVENGVATIVVKITPLPPPTEPSFEEQLAMKCPAGLLEFDIETGRILTLRAEVDAEIVGFRGPGSLLKLKSLHYQKLIESGPTETLVPAKTASSDTAEIR